MYQVIEPDGRVYSVHRALTAAGRVARERMAVRVVDREGKDVTFSAKDAVR